MIEHILHLLVGPGDEVITCGPTWEVFDMMTRMYSGTSIEVVSDGDFAIDVSAVKAAITKSTQMIILCSPNNPTGNLTPLKDILEIVDTGVPVLVDEMDNPLWCTYGPAPHNAYLIGTEGKIIAKQGWYNPEQMESAILAYIGNG